MTFLSRLLGWELAIGGVRARITETEAIKEIECHGVSVTEVVEGAGRAWTVVQASALNRRITPNTPVVFNGPVRGSDLIKTAYSADGTTGRGTINNCANGITPWGTSITCEENWAGYFRRPTADVAGRSAKELTSLNRYGVSGNGNFSWSTVIPADAASTIFRRCVGANTRCCSALESRPNIGITPDHSVHANGFPYYDLKVAYADAVHRAGGLPFILHYADEPATIDINLVDSTGKWLHSRGLYVDYVEQETVDAIAQNRATLIVAARLA